MENKSRAAFPDKERIDLALQLLDRAMALGRALENMQSGAFEGAGENSRERYATVTRELGARVRALTSAASQTLQDEVYELGDAWRALHA
jgi:hypothetical protein